MVGSSRGVLVQELGAEAAMGGFGLLADATSGDRDEAPSGRAARDRAPGNTIGTWTFPPTFS